MPLTKEQLINELKRKVEKKIPTIQRINLTPAQWEAFYDSVVRYKITHLGSILSLFYLKKAFNHSLPIHTFIEMLRKPNQPRVVKKVRASITPTRAPYRHRFYDSPKNGLVIDAKDYTGPGTPLRNTGARIEPLVQGQTSSELAIPLMQTPGGHHVSLFFKQGNVSVHQYITPERPKPKPDPQITTLLSHMYYERATEVSFSVTRQSIEAHKGRPRRVNQQQLTGETCQKIFMAYQINNLAKPKGQDYHWSHLIGYCLGGEQAAENLTPATAASNYNTLEMIEQRILTLLADDTQHHIDCIEMTVTPLYEGSEPIPERLIFKLNWLTQNPSLPPQHHTEEIHIKTQSYHRLTTAEHASVKLLRTLAPPDLNGSSRDDNDSVTINHARIMLQFPE